MKSSLVLGLALLGVAGCATVSVRSYVPNPQPTVRPPDSVAVLYVTPESWYRPLAELHLSGSIVLDNDKLLARLRRDAGKLGADGLILAGLPRTQSTFHYDPVAKSSTSTYSTEIQAVAVSLGPERRPSIAPDSVIIYPKRSKLPKRYEILAERACANQTGMDAQLRTEAGELGANAVFLGAKSSSASQSVYRDGTMAVAAYVPPARARSKRNR